MLLGERIFTLQRLINLRDGYTKEDNVLLPKVYMPAKEGFRVGEIPPVDNLLGEYYKLRRWSKDEKPPMAAQLLVNYLLGFVGSYCSLILTGSKIITKDNVDDPETQAWLYRENFLKF